LVIAGWRLKTAAFHLEASIGAGDTQEVFDFDRTISYSADHTSTSLALVAAGAALVIAALAGAITTRARPLFAIAFAVAACGVIQVERSAHFNSFDDGEGGVYSCDQATEADPGACAGPLLHPAIRRLVADVRARPVGRRAGFEFLGGYRAVPRVGHTLIEDSLVVVLLVAAYASIRLVVRRWWVAILALAGGTLVVLIWLLLHALANYSD
jgi:hypothetical protein